MNINTYSINNKNAIANDLNEKYNLPAGLAEKIASEIKDKYFLEGNDLSEGETFYRAVLLSEPPGRLIAKCKTKRIKLSLLAKEDLEISSKRNLKYLRFVTISRLCWQAYDQGCLLTQRDLAVLLRMSISSIKKIISIYRKKGAIIPTRGNFYDIGPGISSKYHAVKMYLNGLSLDEISFRLHYEISTINRYISIFLSVIKNFLEGYSYNDISDMEKISIPLVKSYSNLYEEFRKNPSDIFLELEKNFNLNNSNLG